MAHPVSLPRPPLVDAVMARWAPTLPRLSLSSLFILFPLYVSPLTIPP